MRFRTTRWLKCAISQCFTIKIACGGYMAGGIWQGKSPKERGIPFIRERPACCPSWSFRALLIRRESKAPTCRIFIPLYNTYKMYVFLDSGWSKTVFGRRRRLLLLSAGGTSTEIKTLATQENQPVFNDKNRNRINGFWRIVKKDLILHFICKIDKLHKML